MDADGAAREAWPKTGAKTAAARVWQNSRVKEPRLQPNGSVL
jgi:hypothetical protein